MGEAWQEIEAWLLDGDGVERTAVVACRSGQWHVHLRSRDLAERAVTDADSGERESLGECVQFSIQLTDGIRELRARIKASLDNTRGGEDL